MHIFAQSIVNDKHSMKENVTSLKEEGPVVVESGKTIVSYSDDVYIKNGFEVKRGAEFFVESYEHP